jgi:hypothetical protein
MNNLNFYNEPWPYWIIDNFLPTEALTELKSIDHVMPQIQPGHRLNKNRLFITENNALEYPNLYNVYKSLVSGSYKEFFEEHTKKKYNDLYPRVEVISDYGPFFLETHHDLLEKKLSALIYTDHEDLHPGTAIYDGDKYHHTVESKDNRCMFFNPAPNTMHAYHPTVFTKIRRGLMINYWSVKE